MSRKRRERRQAAAGPAPSTEAISAPPDEKETSAWPAFWRELAERLHPAWTRVPDPAAPTVRFDPAQRHWSWGGSTIQFVAELLDDGIRWQQEWPEEDGIEQPTVDFLAFGPPPGGAPPLVESDLREAIRARDAARWPMLLNEATSLRRRRNGHFDDTLAARAAVTNNPDYRRSGDFVWEWGEEADGYVAILSRDSISWNWHGPKDFGNSIEQPLSDFVAFGPEEKNAPEGLAWEMFNALRLRDPKRWPKLLAEAKALGVTHEPDDDGGRRRRESWEWGDQFDRYSAFLTDTGIYWSWEGPKDLGGGAEQSFAEFAASGPLDRDAPPDVVRAIQAAIAARGGRESGNGGSPPAGTSPGPASAADDEPAEPLGPLLLQGLAVIGASVAVALLLTGVQPTLAKYASIILPVLLGFAAALRWGSLSLIVAGFFAMVAAFGSQFAYERFVELSRGDAARLHSIAEVARHPEATRFIVTDARVARAFAGSYRHTTIRQHGAGPREQVVVYHVMPLVPRGWVAAQPVPAWIACGISQGFDCLRPAENNAGRTIRVRDDVLPHYRAAIADAERRHRIKSDAGAPVLEPSDDPVDAPAAYLAIALAIPLAIYGLWVLVTVAWRVRRQRQRPAAST